MDINQVREYFNKAALHWDDNIVCDFDKIDVILDCVGISKGDSVLDVGCGTGFMFPFYAMREAACIVGVDLSDEMVNIAKTKTRDKRVSVICSDAASYDYGRLFDRIVIYNALPHFVDFSALFEHLSYYLNIGGTLTVAHSMSREQLTAHHSKVMHISKILPHAEVLAKMFPHNLKVRYIISDEQKYIVSAVKGE